MENIAEEKEIALSLRKMGTKAGNLRNGRAQRHPLTQHPNHHELDEVFVNLKYYFLLHLKIKVPVLQSYLNTTFQRIDRFSAPIIVCLHLY